MRDKKNLILANSFTHSKIVFIFMTKTSAFYIRHIMIYIYTFYF